MSVTRQIHMKLIFVFIALLVSNIVSAVDWGLAFQDDKQKIYIQHGSEKIDHSKISAWLKIEYSAEKKFVEKSFSSQIIKGDFFCNENKLSLYKFVLYDKNLSVVESWSEPNSSDEVIPDSFGGILYTIACDKREIAVVLALVFSKEKQIESVAKKINPKLKTSSENTIPISAIMQIIANRLLKLPYPRGFDIDEVINEEVGKYFKEKQNISRQ